MAHKSLKRVATQSINIFGEDVTYKTFEGGILEIKAIFQESYSDFDAVGIAIDARQPTCWVLERQTGKIDTRDIIEVYGVEYSINDQEPDGFGIVRLSLREM